MTKKELAVLVAHRRTDRNSGLQSGALHGRTIAQTGNSKKNTAEADSPLWYVRRTLNDY